MSSAMSKAPPVRVCRKVTTSLSTVLAPTVRKIAASRAASEGGETCTLCDSAPSARNRSVAETRVVLSTWLSPCSNIVPVCRLTTQNVIPSGKPAASASVSATLRHTTPSLGASRSTTHGRSTVSRAASTKCCCARSRWAAVRECTSNGCVGSAGRKSSGGSERRASVTTRGPDRLVLVKFATSSESSSKSSTSTASASPQAHPAPIPSTSSISGVNGSNAGAH
mmetsp:Transcript_8475/g.19494  ORF Transcript_8475/g.19494 Transcript_8475/m.19494 type:complete len:224 (-) Transcript_8475:1949-2620(-)